jgi:hypothetical protein
LLCDLGPLSVINAAIIGCVDGGQSRRCAEVGLGAGGNTGKHWGNGVLDSDGLLSSGAVTTVIAGEVSTKESVIGWATTWDFNFGHIQQGVVVTQSRSRGIWRRDRSTTLKDQRAEVTRDDGQVVVGNANGLRVADHTRGVEIVSDAEGSVESGGRWASARQLNNSDVDRQRHVASEFGQQRAINHTGRALSTNIKRKN